MGEVRVALTESEAEWLISQCQSVIVIGSQAAQAPCLSEQASRRITQEVELVRGILVRIEGVIDEQN